jgi:hypothetical protein
MCNPGVNLDGNGVGEAFPKKENNQEIKMPQETETLTAGSMIQFS